MDVNDADDNHGYYVEQRSKMARMEGKAGEEIAGKDIADEEIAGENIHRQDTLAMQGASGAGVRGSHSEEKISEIFLCSISFEIMSDPVTTADGQTYERGAIMQWFRQGKTTSPLTGVVLPVPTGDAFPALIPNHMLRAAIEQWRSSKYMIEHRSAITIGVQIGGGSFKKVFEGTFHGVRVAVAMMLQGSIAGELEMLIKVSRHPNLLRLLACVMDGTAEQLISPSWPR